jgi:hypothetical protein
MKAAIFIAAFLAFGILFIVTVDKWIRNRPERDESEGSYDPSGGSDGVGGD